MRVRARAGLLFSESPQAPPRPRFQPARTPHKSSPAGQVWEGRVAGKRAVRRPDGLITWAPARVEGFRPAGSAVVVTLGQLSPARVAGARRSARAVATKRSLKRREPAARGLIPPPARVHVHGAVRLLPRCCTDHGQGPRGHTGPGHAGPARDIAVMQSLRARSRASRPRAPARRARPPRRCPAGAARARAVLT